MATIANLNDIEIIDCNSDSDSDYNDEVVNKSTTFNGTIKNPFFSKDEVLIGNEFIKLIDLTQKEFYNNFNKLYVLCLKKDVELKEYIYNDNLSIYDLDNLVKDFELLEGDLKLLNNNIHKSQVVYIDSYYLKLFNKTFELNEKELLIPFINISSDTFKLYHKQYFSHFKIKDYFSIKLTNKFYSNNMPNINYISEILKNSESSNYWTKKFHVKLNITNKFINRTFNLSLNQRINNEKLKQVLNDINKMPKEGDTYLNYIYRKSLYVDISSIIKRNGYSLYNITNLIDMTEHDVNFLLENQSSTYEFYNLTMSLLISKDYCHFVLNNPNYMNKLINYSNPSNNSDESDSNNNYNFINKYIIAFQYAISYSWLTLYMEECIKKSKIIESDRFVFTIDQANKLPTFPFSSSFVENKMGTYRYHPYLPILISENVLDLPNNTMGAHFTFNDINDLRLKDNEDTYTCSKIGVVDLNTFKKNFNIFLCSNHEINLLDNVDMSNLGICGSLIPACITSFNPLMRLYDSKDRYFKEYYSDSDIDIMCNLKDDFEFVDRINKFYTEFSENIKKQSNYLVDISSHKIAALIVNETFINKNIVNPQMNYEFILTNLDNEDVKKLFYKFYIDYKINENKKYFSSDKWKNKNYNIIFDIVPIENIRIIFGRTKLDWKNYWKSQNSNNKNESDEFCNNPDKIFDLKTEDNIFDPDNTDFENNLLLKCHENIKFKISSSYLNHELEIFKIRWDSFIGTVSNFHLPCVRGYFDGNQVYLLPSCITAASTLINLDYKYFAGSRDPIEIINKYRNRGYSVILNDNEKIRLTSYSLKVDKWSTLYDNPNIQNKSSINKIFGYLPLDSNFFKPRKLLKEEYNNLKPVDDDYKSITVDNSNKFYCTSLKSIYPNIKTELFNICNLQLIDNTGYVNPINKWQFDAIYSNS